MRITRQPTRILGAALLTAGLATCLTIAPAGAAVNLLKNPSFEKPVVSGAVNLPPGSAIGKCANGAPYPGSDFHCWRVGAGAAELIHDDYLIGGVAVKPKAGHQFVALVGSTSPTGGPVPGAVSQATNVASSTTPTLRFSYATMPTPGTTSAIHVVVNACTANGVACVTDVDVTLFTLSTGKPAKMGWKTFTAPIPVNADEGLVQVSISGTASPRATGIAAIDAFSLE